MRSVKQQFDFHCHSTASDGSLTPEEMLELAEKNELKAWSLTDHDTLAGYYQLEALNNSLRLKCRAHAPKLVPGVEISCDWNNTTLHVLAFAFSPESYSISTFLKMQQSRRQQRAVSIGQRVQDKLKISDAYEKACMISEDRLPARPHFARVLIESGVVESFNEAFKRYLGAGKWGDVKLFWPTMAELLEAVHQAGGIAAVAHPFHYGMTATKLRRLLDEFAGLGGEAVELSVPNISNGHFGWLVNELNRRKLAQSGGSDFHGTFTPWSKLGFFPQLSDKVPSVAEFMT